MRRNMPNQRILFLPSLRFFFIIFTISFHVLHSSSSSPSPDPFLSPLLLSIINGDTSQALSILNSQPSSLSEAEENPDIQLRQLDGHTNRHPTSHQQDIPPAPSHEDWTPLVMSTYLGNFDIVTALLSKGYPVNQPGLDGWTPLMIACREGHVEIVQALLAHHANIHLISYNNVHALSAAEASGNSEILKLINEAIAHSDSSKLFLTSTNTISLILTAAYSSSPQSLLSTIAEEGGESNINERSLGDLTPLMLAASAGRPENVELLLSHGADKNLQDHRGWTALMFAVQSNCLTCIELLLTFSSPPPPSSSLPSPAVAPVPVSAPACRVELMNDSGHTASDIAERRGFPELGQEIFGVGYCHAVQRLDLEAILEIARVGGNPNVQCRSAGGYTPLILATRLGDESAVKLLLDAAADPNLSEGSHWTPLMFAILRNSSHIVELLLDYGATVNSYGSSSPPSASGPGSPLQLLKLLREEEEAEGRGEATVSPEILDMITYASHREIERIMSPGFVPVALSVPVVRAGTATNPTSPDPTSGPTLQRLAFYLRHSFSSSLPSAASSPFSFTLPSLPSLSLPSLATILPASFTEIMGPLLSPSTVSSADQHSALRSNSTPAPSVWSLSLSSASSWLQDRLLWGTIAPSGRSSGRPS